MLRFLVALMAFGSCAASAQLCPHDNPSGPPVESASRTLSGKVVLHQGIRVWLELTPDIATCGETSIQLVPNDFSSDKTGEKAYSKLELARGCHVTVTGQLNFPMTGYYSAPIYIGVEKMTPDENCQYKAPLPDYSSQKPDSSLRSYNVTMLVNYRGEGSVRAVIQANGKQWGPWQAYANHMLTGGFVFYGHCADGFTMRHVRGTSAANPGQTDEVASMDPETAAEKGVKSLRLSFTCSR